MREDGHALIWQELRHLAHVVEQLLHRIDHLERAATQEEDDL